jgi:hypothetical protein
MCDTLKQASGGVTDEAAKRLLGNLERYAVPMLAGDFSRETYQRFFPRGTVQTPIGEVKLGKNQFAKLQEKDQGKRMVLIGAMFQTLSDPVAIIKETEEGREAAVFIKSFTKQDAPTVSTVLSVVVTLESQKIAISTYKRKRREVVNKIKKADGIVFEKTDSGSRTNGEEYNSTRHQ